MKKILLAAAAALTALVACQKNEVAAPEADSVLYATIEETDATKTYMDSNNNIRWSEGDQVVAFMKTSLGLRYQIKNQYVGKTSGYFSQVSSGSTTDLGAGTEWDHNIVYYPYSDAVEAAKSGSSYTLDVVLSSEQTYAPDSFGEGSMAMVAVSENNNITFRNVLGGMKLQLKGTQKLTSITLEGKNSEKLSGTATVTAYTDETKPAITMSSSASTSVTLDCGSGVQLSESKATEFIIALPPVLFSKGFTVVVTDAEGQTYTVGTDKANTVLRSSILTMPAFKLGETPVSGSPENAVDLIMFDLDELTVVPGTTYTMIVDFEPYDAADKTLAWSSSNASVASVDNTGTISSHADGTAVITAVAVGGVSATCTVTVKSCVVPSMDYEVDGANYGKGIAIGDIVWAPVNCGYHPTDYPYGKLYQWGRPYGQGFDSSDASYPSGDNLVEGPVMPSVGLSEENKDRFYYNNSPSYDWSKVQQDDLWNSGTELSPIKTKYDPCPTGWRVPTGSELNKLCQHKSSWTSVNGQNGYYFAGEYTYLNTAPQVFFPAAGYRAYDDGRALFRGWIAHDGCYWSSRPYILSSIVHYSYDLLFDSGRAHTFHDGYRANGYSVRCVQE